MIAALTVRAAGGIPLPVGRWAESRTLLPMLSGLLLAFAYFPFDLLVPNLVAFLPMLFWLDARLDAPWRERFRGGFVFGLAVHLTILHWMYAMLSISVLAALLYLLLASLFAACVALSTTLASWLRRETGWSWAVLLPLAWLPVEWAATWGDTRMTAHHLGNTLGGFPFLVQFADLVGPYGIGAFLLIVNGLFLDLLTPRSRGRLAPALTLLVLLGAVVGYDGWKWSHPPEATGWMRVALVQPNIPLVEKMDPEEDDRQWQVLEELTVRAAKEKPAVVVWPETARPKALYHDVHRPETYAMPDVQALAKRTGAAILAGAEYARIDGKQRSYYNAAFLVDRDGALDEVWTAKSYLVPFVEKTPFEPILGRLLRGQQWLGGGFRPGPEATPLEVAGTKVGVLVCYEELYWDLVRKLRSAGAGFTVIITNDAWFGRTVFQEYQANTVRMRAIENRMALVRVANTGISGFVDPMGRYSGETALFVPAVEAEEVPITSVRTVYTRYGDYVAWIAIAGLVLASGTVRMRKRRTA
jgi:apolipoprotein N-acyltransferase